MAAPYLLAMRDREMVSAIVAGDPAGLTAAYDRYAASLHAYCWSLLADPADAAGAVQDIFVIAIARLGLLRDPDSALAWLYAVARNECHRRHRDRAAATETTETAGTAGAWPPSGAEPPRAWAAGPAPFEAGEVSADLAAFTADGERSEPHELVAAAIAALDPGERDVVELHLRHDVDEAGLAAILGLSRRQAHTLVSRARKHFEASLSALLVARAGLEFCPDLAVLLAGWDGELTAALRKQVNRHIRRCSVCGERKRRKLQSAMLLGLRPLPALPDDLWRQVIALVRDDAPDRVAYRAYVAERAEPFGKSGFPVPLDPPTAPRTPKRPVLAAVVGLAALAVLGTGTVIMTTLPNTEGPDRNPGSGPGIQATKPAPAQQVPPTPPGGSPTPGRGAKAPAAPVGATAPPGPTTLSPTTPAPPVPSVSQGTLTASPTTVNLRRPKKGGPPTGSFTLTADGGPVAAFTITVPADHVGDLTVTPATGSLAEGESVEIGVTLRKDYAGPLHTQLSVDPGDLAITVTYRLRHH